MIRENYSPIPTQEQQPAEDSLSKFFDLQPELRKIGTVAEYANYLERIFPNSKFKDVAFRGVADNGLDPISAGNNQTVLENWIFFTPQMSAAESYAQDNASLHGGDPKVLGVKLKIENPFPYKGSPYYLRDAIAVDYFMKTKNFRLPDGYDLVDFVNADFSYIVHFANGFDTYEERINYAYQDKPVIQKTLMDLLPFYRAYTEFNTEFKKSDEYKKFHLINYLQENYDSVVLGVHKDKSHHEKHGQIAVFKKQQVHVLGSERDIASFKSFNEYSRSNQSSQ